MSGIAKRYGYQNVQKFYKIYHKSHNAYADYKEQEAEWEKAYEIGEKNNSIHEKIQEYYKNSANKQAERRTAQRKDKGAR